MCEWLLNLGGIVFALCPAHSHPTTTQVRIYEFNKKSKLATPCFKQHGIVWESVVMHVNERVAMHVNERVVMQVSERVMMNVSENMVMHVSERGVLHVSCHWHILRVFISE